MDTTALTARRDNNRRLVAMAEQFVEDVRRGRLPGFTLTAANTLRGQAKKDLEQAEYRLTCALRRRVGRPRTLSLFGHHTGSLVVYNRATDQYGKVLNGGRWVCRCGCGRTVLRYGWHLKAGLKSCGCRGRIAV